MNILKDTYDSRPTRPSRARYANGESLDTGGTLWILSHSNVPSDLHN